MNWTFVLIIVVFASFLSTPVSGINGLLKASILQTYNNLEVARGRYYMLQNLPLNPCLDSVADIRELYDRVVTSSSSNILISDVLLSLDDRERIRIPAVIECTPTNSGVQIQLDNGNYFQYWLIVVVRPGSTSWEFVKVIKDYEPIDGMDTYVTEAAYIIRVININYGTEYLHDKLKQWYMDIYSAGNYVESCITALTAARKLDGNVRVVTSGIVKLGSFILQLDTNWRVTLPGIIACNVQILGSRNTETLYFIKEREGGLYTIIYDSHVVTDGRHLFVLDKDLRHTSN